MSAQTEEPAEEIGYADAMAELDGILDELEGDDLDVDVLAAKVRRASELVKACRTRIARARTDVDAIVADLESFERELDGGRAGAGADEGDFDEGLDLD